MTRKVVAFICSLFVSAQSFLQWAHMARQPFASLVCDKATSPARMRHLSRLVRVEGSAGVDYRWITGNAVRHASCAATPVSPASRQKGPRIPPLRRPRSRWRSPKHVFFGQKRLLWLFLLLGFRTFPRTKYQQITVHSLSMIRTQYEEINLFATRDT